MINKPNLILMLIAIIGLIVRILTVLRHEIIPVDAIEYMNLSFYIFNKSDIINFPPREIFYPIIIGILFFVFLNTNCLFKIFNITIKQI